MMKKKVIYLFGIISFSYSCSTLNEVNKSIVFLFSQEIHIQREAIEETIVVTKRNKKSLNVNIKLCVPYDISFDTNIVVNSNFIKKIDSLDSIISTYQTYRNVILLPSRFYSLCKISYQGINKQIRIINGTFFAHKYLFCKGDLVNVTCDSLALLIPYKYREFYFKSSD